MENTKRARLDVTATAGVKDVAAAAEKEALIDGFAAKAEAEARLQALRDRFADPAPIICIGENHSEGLNVDVLFSFLRTLIFLGVDLSTITLAAELPNNFSTFASQIPSYLLDPSIKEQAITESLRHRVRHTTYARQSYKLEDKEALKLKPPPSPRAMEQSSNLTIANILAKHGLRSAPVDQSAKVQEYCFNLTPEERSNDEFLSYYVAHMNKPTHILQQNSRDLHMATAIAYEATKPGCQLVIAVLGANHLKYIELSGAQNKTRSTALENLELMGMDVVPVLFSRFKNSQELEALPPEQRALYPDQYPRTKPQLFADPSRPAEWNLSVGAFDPELRDMIFSFQVAGEYHERTVTFDLLATGIKMLKELEKKEVKLPKFDKEILSRLEAAVMARKSFRLPESLKSPSVRKHTAEEQEKDRVFYSTECSALAHDLGKAVKALKPQVPYAAIDSAGKPTICLPYRDSLVDIAQVREINIAGWASLPPDDQAILMKELEKEFNKIEKIQKNLPSPPAILVPSAPALSAANTTAITRDESKQQPLVAVIPPSDSTASLASPAHSPSTSRAGTAVAHTPTQSRAASPAPLLAPASSPSTPAHSTFASAEATDRQRIQKTLFGRKQRYSLQQSATKHKAETSKHHYVPEPKTILPKRGGFKLHGSSKNSGKVELVKYGKPL